MRGGTGALGSTSSTSGARAPVSHSGRPSLTVANLAGGVASTLRPSLGTLFDALGECVLAWQPPAGAIFHNSALERLLRQAPDRERVTHGLARIAAEVWAESKGRRAPFTAGRPNSQAASFHRELRFDKARYRCRGHHLESDMLWRDGMVLVIVGERENRLLDSSELRRRFGLTPRETEVALLLADGCSNANVAEALVMSHHTARRHTEQVLAKLDVRSRARAGALIRRI
jgi:DNA-binding CsgD family transcriptional regulator